MQRVTDFFRSQNIFLPDEVIAILHHEVAPTAGTPQQIGPRALDLWKSRDLRTFYSTGSSDSPLNSIVQATTKVFTVSQTVCLQIDFLRDISCPAYLQLQKAINRFGENVLVNGDAPTQPPGKFAENGKRMLLLTLTDGVHTIQAMEYQFIHVLSTSTPPGTKVRLLPPIMCRKGLLMLKPTNIQIIGGQVPALEIRYAQKHVLATILNADLEALEKAAPPCGPPRAAAVAGLPAAAVPLNNAIHNDGFDDDGDALLAAVPDDWGLDADADDAFLGDALDQFDAQIHGA